MYKLSSLSSTIDAMEEMLRDALRQVMESELDAERGYEKVSTCLKRLWKTNCSASPTTLSLLSVVSGKNIKLLMVDLKKAYVEISEHEAFKER